MRAFIILVVVFFLPLLAACGGPAAGSTILLATTTSTDNSGLLDFLLPTFEEREGVKVNRIAVGTGRALAIARKGEADIILVHARAREDAFVAEGFGIDRRDIMWNDFVIAGPAADPAGIRGACSAADALKQLAGGNEMFVSRGDDSGTHTRERDLWKAAEVTPDWSGYRSAGQGMGACLNIAHELRAYVLTDRGTFLAYGKKVDLEVLVEGEPGLRNPYGAILVNPAKHPHVNAEGAKKLLDYLTSPEGRAKIEAFRVDGKVLFHAHGGN